MYVVGGAAADNLFEQSNRISGHWIFDSGKAKNPARLGRAGFSTYCSLISLTITYFHTGCSTIIGAKSFHGPVRDGKGWYRPAMVIRHDLYGRRVRAVLGAALNLEEVVLSVISNC